MGMPEQAELRALVVKPANVYGCNSFFGCGRVVARVEIILLLARVNIK